MKKIIYLVVLAFIGHPSTAQTVKKHPTVRKNTTKQPSAIGKQAFLDDFTLFRNILEKAHAGLYKYHSKRSVDSVFEHYRRQIGAATTLPGFYRSLSAILTYIGSLHDEIGLPKECLDTLVRRPVFFPYPVKIVDRKLLVNADGQSISAGAAITAINGLPVDSIIPRLYKYYTTDGMNITGKLLGIGSSFSLFYRYEFGPAARFNITYQPFAAQQTATVTLPAVTYKDYLVVRNKRHSLYLDTLLDDRYTFEIIDSLQTAVLTVNSFSLGSEGSKKHTAYKQFLRQCFTILREKKIPNLVVDIRKNGGGTDPNDLLTFSYLAQRPFYENKEAFTIFQQVPFKKYYSVEDSADIPGTEENFREEHNQLRDGRYYQNPDFNKAWQPDSLAYKGRLYLLIGPAVASAASLFASLVKSEGYATVIGEESMGGYYGHTGHNKLYYQLPRTQIDFAFSVVDLLQFVVPKKDIPFGAGIIPDKVVAQTQHDFILNRDAVMQYVLELIGSRK